ncbi:aminoacyl tRNA synthase complex-interacting multifunctional protein 1-like [Chenopodium quinoa]|uniref:tRNA-binding domain-containing protein n=1 Tax=Chenopodium quinoa TaxID=63459 RepID=A0A803KU05_CHEQI|nr:aminoacyl tRNA synthase complex-interacting multifunctional protein 1-like [Chenopodium quinoa]
MAAANANHLLKARGTILFYRHNHHNFIPPRFLPFSLLPSLNTKPTSTFPSLSSISHLPFTPSPSTPPRHFRFLCTSSDASTLSSTSTSAAVDSGSPPQSEPPVPDMAAVKEAANMLDIRVGKVVKAWQHPDADSLYVEEVDVGEDEPRTICSGLVKYVPIDQLQDKKVLVLANLKPRNMRGIKSNGMLMAASDASHENVELLVPPEDSVPGERIWFGSEEEKENQTAAATANQIQKKKIWELVQPHLKTDAACIAMLDGHYMRTSAGLVVSKSLKDANIS